MMATSLLLFKRLSGDYMVEIVRFLDFDDINIVEDVCKTYKEFVDWNKGYFDYEIFNPKIPLDCIYIAHNLWDEGELSTAEAFLNDLDEILNDYLQLYPDNEDEQWEDVMKYFGKFQ